MGCNLMALEGFPLEGDVILYVLGDLLEVTHTGDREMETGPFGVWS